MIEAVVFDMDGVLIDSVASAYRVKAKVLQEDYGIDIAAIPDPHGEEHKGGSLDGLIAAVQQHHDIAIDRDVFAPKVVAAVYQDLLDNGVKADPELVAFLDDLKAHNVPLAVATSSLKVSTENKLRILGIKDYFGIIITGDDVKEHKPHPESYIAAMERLHARPNHSFVFEDSLQGIEAGRAAGAHVIGVANYSTSKEPLPDTKLTIGSWSEVNYRGLLALLA